MTQIQDLCLEYLAVQDTRSIMQVNKTALLFSLNSQASARFKFTFKDLIWKKRKIVRTIHCSFNLASIVERNWLTTQVIHVPMTDLHTMVGRSNWLFWFSLFLSLQPCNLRLPPLMLQCHCCIYYVIFDGYVLVYELWYPRILRE